MRFNEQWLEQWIDLTWDADELARQLTMAGLEVVSVEATGEKFTGVIVAKVQKVEQHPHADRLTVCQVDAGQDELLTVVCGAPNVREGLPVALATIGARLPGGFKIKKNKLRGVVSYGMLCSADELKLNDTSDGIMELSPELEIGADVYECLHDDDCIIELELTANRGDCASILGLAREVATLSRQAMPKVPDLAITPSIKQTYAVQVMAPQACPKYLGRLMTGLDNTVETPAWLQKRLHYCGLSSINPIVDVMNYVMLEVGQAMHAFDADVIDKEVIIRHAKAGESLTLINEQTIALCETDLIIADVKKPLALAGVMGGASSAVNTETKHVFLESACFAPHIISVQARRYGLITDAAQRFERGVDPNMARYALERASELLLQITGGQVGAITAVEHDELLPQPQTIRLRYDRIEKILGCIIPKKEVATILDALNMQCTADGDNAWHVKAPSHRLDMAIEEDLIEEIARVYGYHRIQMSPIQGELQAHQSLPEQLQKNKALHFLVSNGYHETIHYSFVDAKLTALLHLDKDALTLSHPISSDLSQMRTSLWPNLIASLHYNYHRKVQDVRLFERGICFTMQKDQVVENLQWAGLIAGSKHTDQWNATTRALDFYDIKADVMGLLGKHAKELVWEQAEHPSLHPGQSARVMYQGRRVAWVGALHPRIKQTLGLPMAVFLFSLDIDALPAVINPSYTPIFKYPSIRRDMALLVDAKVTGDHLIQLVQKSAHASLQDVVLFDVYLGKGIPEGKKSVAIALMWRDRTKTLTDKEVDKFMNKIVVALEKEEISLRT